jgi:hypothetical protein
MTKIFGAYMDKFLIAFVDDLNIHILIWAEHLEHIRFVLMKLREMNFKFNPYKCEFAKTSIHFLMNNVIRKGTQPDQQKVKAIIELPIPMLVTNVCVFLRLNGYYKNYVKRYSKIAILLFELTKRDVVFSWNNECQNAFNVLKDALVKTLILISPNFTKPFTLNLD